MKMFVKYIIVNFKRLKIIQSFFYLFLIFFFSCSESIDSEYENFSDSQLVVIIDGSFEAPERELPNGGFIKFEPRLLYLGKDKLAHSIPIVPNDTIVVNSSQESNFFNFSLNYYQIFNNDYLMFNKDTIELKYLKEDQRFKIVEHQSQKEIINEFDIHVHEENLREINTYEQIFFNVNETENKRRTILKKTILDSLQFDGKLSSQEYQFYKTNHLLLLAIDSLDKKPNEFKINTFLDSLNQDFDELLANRIFRMFLLKHINTKTSDIPLVESKSGYTQNYKLLFNYILDSDIYDKQTKDYILYTYMVEMLNKYPSSIFDEYYNKYQYSNPDELYLKSLTKKIKSQMSSSSFNVEDVVLLTSENEKTTLKDVLNLNLGAIIYLDFWASWCVPCRNEIPHSIKLNKQLNRQDVVFIYLSIDENQQNWLYASRQDSLTDVQNNYLILNYPESIFFQQNNLRTIPRYMIVGRDGLILESDAPSPSNPEIFEFFNSL